MVGQHDGDRLLVELAQQGEREAFGLLVARYQNRTLRLVSRLVPNPSDAEDVVQDTFIKAFRSLQTFRGDASFSTWLYRVAINVAKTHWKASSRRISSLTSIESDNEHYGDAAGTQTTTDTPESILARKQLEKKMISGIEALPFDLRTALVLREIDDLSYEEIAEIMSCPLGTVRSRIFRARESLARYVADG